VRRKKPAVWKAIQTAAKSETVAPMKPENAIGIDTAFNSIFRYNVWHCFFETGRSPPFRYGGLPRAVNLAIQLFRFAIGVAIVFVILVAVLSATS